MKCCAAAALLTVDDVKVRAVVVVLSLYLYTSYQTLIGFVISALIIIVADVVLILYL